MGLASSDRRQYHIGCKKGELSGYLLIPGDPDRLPKITALWDSRDEVSNHREFRSFTGKYKKVPISALSSGIGPAAMSIAVNEAMNIGVHTFIRVGSTGAIQEDIDCGDLIISSGAVRLDGTSDCYVIPEYPAVANYEVLLALIEAAETLRVKGYHVGITATTNDFYAGQSRQTAVGCSSQAENLMPVLQEARVLNFEMETATLFTLASLCGLRAGAVCAVFANRLKDEFKVGAGEGDAVKVANEAVKILNEWDGRRRAQKKKWLYPSLMGKHV
jgi:uridine phosphorylase